jgi:uncharacterized protein YcbK (DUF882 family)
MLRVAFLGAAFLFATVTGPRFASAEGDEPGSEDAAGAGGEAAGDTGDAEAPPPPTKRKRGGKRSRHAAAKGHVAPEASLRRDPLPRPTGHLHLISANLKDEVNVNLYNDDGSYDLDALAQLNHVLRCRRTECERPMDTRLLTLLSHVYDHFGSRPLEVVSGYRNQRKLTSNHVKGTASDIRIKGVNIKQLRAFAETLDTGGMGIGIYPRSGFVHIDVRPLPSYRWVDYSRPGSNASEKRPPRGWKRKKLQS